VPIPSIDALTGPMLEELSDGAERSTRELWERLALRFGLTSKELAERNDSGRFVFRERVGWARSRLRKRGLLDYPRRAHARITAAGLDYLVACGGGAERAEAESGGAERAEAEPATEPVAAGPALPHPFIGPGPLERELRELTGPAAEEDADWGAIRLLNGWDADGVLSHEEVARRTGRTVADLLVLGRRCRRGDVGEAPILDAVLAFVCAHPWLDPDEVPFHLAQLGFAWSRFSIAGVAEAARRFGREPQWRMLVRQIATARGRGSVDDGHRLPRPFESWFEVEVFLFLDDHGYVARPKEYTGRYRADLVVETDGGPVIIECDGEAWYRGDRADRDRAREHGLIGAGFKVIRIPHDAWVRRTTATQASLLDALGARGPLRSAG